MPDPDRAERIAIVGIGGIFPGALDLDTFWQNVAGGVDSGRQVPEGRWYLSPEKAYAPWPPQPDRVYSTRGCFIEGFQLDPTGLNIEPELLVRLDPMFHLGLHAARAAFRDARRLEGIDLLRVGVILGNIALPTESTSAICRDVLGRTFVEKLIDAAAESAESGVRSAEWKGVGPGPLSSDDARCSRVENLKSSLHRAGPPSNMLATPDADSARQRSTFDHQPSSTPRSALRAPHSWHPLNRYAAGLPSSLIAQALGFGGMAFTLDAACASSLYALKFASEELLAHRADTMLAGGMSRPDCQYTQMGFAQLQALSRSGRCAPLSAEADGLVVGEGAGVFVLKRLSDAVAAGDQIYGVIAGIGLSNDRGANLLAPHSEGQLRAMRSAYEQAGWSPSDVDLIECHATGTPVGDAVEIESLHQLWQHESARPGQCVIGGVKSNVGHLLTGAGAAGLMKVLFALKHQTLPPTANYARPAERLTAPTSPFRVLSQAEPWTQRSDGSPRRATINAFGFGGINAHVLIEEWNASLVPSPPPVFPQTKTVGERGEGTGEETIPIAIVGLDTHVGTWDSPQSVQENDFQGKPREWTELNWWGVEQSDWIRREGHSDDTGFVPNQPAKPTGYGITEVRLPIGQFRIPPLEMQDMLPQQQLMLKVAAGAIRDAKRERGRTEDPVEQASADCIRLRTGVFIGIELDPNTTNFHLRWSVEQDAPHWAEMLGLDLTPDELADWTKGLKDAVGPPLTPNRVMGNLGGIVASRLAREFDVGGPSFTISCGGDSGGIAFDLAVRALQRGELDRAIVGAVELPCEVRLMLSAANTSAPDGAIAFVLQRSDDAQREGRMVRDAIEDRRRLLTVSLSPRKEPLAAFQSLPATHSLLGPLPFVLKAVTSFRSRRPQGSSGQLAFVFPGSGNAFVGMGHELLAAFPDVLRHQAAENKRLRDQYRPDLIWEGHSTAALLENHKAMIFGQVAMGTAICDLLALFGVRPTASVGYSLGESAALFGLRAWTDRDEMLQRMQLSPLFGSDLVAPFDAARKAWGVPDDEDVPWLSGVIDRSADDVRAAIASLIPSPPPVFSQTNTVGERARVRGPSAEKMLDTSTSCPEERTPHPNPLPSKARGEGTRKDSVRRGSPDPAEGTTEGLLFSSLDQVAVKTYGRPFRRGQETRAEQRVYLLIVNTPTQCVIGGDRTQVEQLVRNMAATFMPLAAPSTVHCAVLREVEAAYRQLHLMRTSVPRVEGRGARGERGNEPSDAVASSPVLSTQYSAINASIDFYSAAWGRKYELSRESAAEAIVAQAVNTIDFPRVIEQAYADGVRVFVEIGPGSSCTKMIDEILGDRPHLARAALPNTSRPVETFLELLAALIVEGVPVDLSYLYREGLRGEGRGSSAREEAASTPQLPPSTFHFQPSVVREIVTRVGGLPFEIPTPPCGWKFSENVPPPVTTGDLTVECDSTIESHFSNDKDPVQASTANSTQYSVLSTLESVLGTPDSVPDARHLSLLSRAPDHPPSTLNPFELLQAMTDHRMQAHETFLRFSARAERLAAEHLAALARMEAGVRRTEGTEVTEEANEADRITDRIDVTTPTSFPSLPSFPSLDPHPLPLAPRSTPPRSLKRDECLTFAIGKIGDVLGQMFAAIDQHPTRVRLPDEPLMLVDRILTIEGEPLSMTSGRVVTEHDIHPGAWYLDYGRIPTCIAVESGQADLFLSGWLGIDIETKGLASYRLLDAVVTFHDELPQAGKTIHYDIRVLHFFRQGSTYLFRFEFDATVDGRPLLTMREGCAGFFTEAELAGGKGIIHTALDRRPRPGTRPPDWSDPVPMAVESYADSQLLALRRGDLAACFGPAFGGLPLREPVTIPGIVKAGSVRRGSPDPAGVPTAGLPVPTLRDSEAETFGRPFRRGQETRAEQSSAPSLNTQPSTFNRSRMWLIDRVLKLDPEGGKFGMGTILGELDIHPDDWFLTCHFCDDQVMPGTLMYECCLHTLRIFLLRMGWVGEAGQIVHEPIPAIRSRLKCRGQVLSSTKKVWYEVTLKEIGYGEARAVGRESRAGEESVEGGRRLIHADHLPRTTHAQPSTSFLALDTRPSALDSSAYCLADALMYADGKPIVEITDMSVRLTGLSREKVERLWSGKRNTGDKRQETEAEGSPSIQSPDSCLLTPPPYDCRPAIFDTDRITAFAIGKPSEAFGDRYRVFDDDRRIARLPGPPFQFLDRVVSIENCQPWKLEAGGEIVAQYDIPADAWYFAANRQPTMPFAVLLETALQPCGWLAAYLGSALTSETDLSFRNLGGKAMQYREVTPQSGTLTTRVKITKVSQSGGMIIQNFDYHLSCDGEPVYVGDTYFGFFAKASLANQVGIRDAKVFVPSPEESSRASRFDSPDAAPFANSEFQMIDNAELLLDGGPHGLGFVRGTMRVDPSAWFFKAHFYQDPVVPGSLGLESFFQLLKFYAAARWRLGPEARFQTPSLRSEQWAVGSGQVKTPQLGVRSSATPHSPLSTPHEWVYRGQVIPHDKLVTVTAVIGSVDDTQRQVTAEGFLSVDGRVIYQMKSFTLAVS